MIYYNYIQMLNLKNGKPLNLIFQDSMQEKFIVNQMALEHMKKYVGNYSFISICGDYRTGKSFLLNSLFFDGDGFQTNCSTESCTKGIKIWSQPLQSNGLYLWIIDTEGFGSIQKDSSYDGKIFLMNLLLSNMVLYNSFGAIDENSISKLAMICRQAKFIDESIQSSKLFWVLRDFSLQMVDKNGESMTENEYLQQCLSEHSHNSNKTQKQFLKRVFQERHCVSLIRPVIDQQKLSNLKETNKVYLRQQFKSKIGGLHDLLLERMNGKIFKGVAIGNHNLQIFVKEFLKTINSNEVDTNLNSTYDRIIEYQMQIKQQKIAEYVKAKVGGLQKMLPVQQQHIAYLKEENVQYIKEQVGEMHVNAEKQALQLMFLTLSTEANMRLMELEKTNLEYLEGEIQQYLYRNLIEIYPKLIVINLANFQTRYTEFISKIKLDYKNKYESYFLGDKNLNSFYNKFMEQEEKKIFFELAKRWRLNHKQIEEKYEELKKSKKTMQEQMKKMRQQKARLGKSTEQIIKQKQKSLQVYKWQIEQAFREEVKVVATDYQNKMRQLNRKGQQELRQLRNKMDAAQRQRHNICSELRYENKSLGEQIHLEKQKYQLLTFKNQQLKSTNQSQQEQTKNHYENKMKILQVKYAELNTTHLNERKKYHLLSQQRKIEESKIIQDLFDKSERIEYLSQQIVNMQHKYKQQMQKILLEQKDILCKTINSKINQYQYKCKVYQNKIAEYAEENQEKQYYRAKSEDFQHGLRQMQSQLEDAQTCINNLQTQIQKNQNELLDKESKFKQQKSEYEKQLLFARQNVASTKKYQKEYEQRNIQQLQYIKSRLQNEYKERIQSLIVNNDQNFKQNKVLLEHKFDKERSQLKEIIKNNYDEIENLKIQKLTIMSQMDKIYMIIHRIKVKFQNIGNHNAAYESQNEALSDRDNSYQLVNIAESPEEHSEIPNSRQKYNNEEVQFLAEQIQEIYDCLTKQLFSLRKQRGEVREELQSNIEELQSYEKLISKVKIENKQLKAQLQELRKKASQLQSISQKFSSLSQKYETIQKQSESCKKQLQLKDQKSLKRQQLFKQNVMMYKQAISNLTEQNKALNKQVNRLSQTSNYLQSELERFKIWSSQVKLKENDLLKESNHNHKERKEEKIVTLENEIKKLLKKLQEQKMEKLEKQTKKDMMVLTNIRNQNRLNEIETLREENYFLHKKIEEINQKQLKSFEEKKQNKIRKVEQEQMRYSSLKDEFQTYKKKNKQTISKLQSQIKLQIDQNKQLKKELLNVETNIIKRMQFKQKVIQEEIQELKREKISLGQSLNRKNHQINQMMINNQLQSKRRRGEMEREHLGYRQELQKEHSRMMLESQRYRLKYDHLLKVNGELIKEIQSLKSKAHQITIKQKYRQKIANLFKD